MFGLRGFESDEAVLRHAENVTEGLCLGNCCRFLRASSLTRFFTQMRFVIFNGDGYRAAFHHALVDHQETRAA